LLSAQPVRSGPMLSLMMFVSCDPGLLDQLGQGSPSATSTHHAHARCGYIAEYIGYDAFAANASSYDVIHPQWYKIASDSVSVAPLKLVDDSRVVTNAQSYGVALMPMVAGVDDPVRIEAMLDSQTLRDQHVEALVNLAVTKGYAGLDLDYEHLPASYRDRVTAFVAEFADAMHAHGLEASLTVTTQAYEKSAFDYAALASAADHLHMMGYDYHWSGSHPGPLSPLGWIAASANHAASTGLASKFILLIPNYAYQPTSYCALGDCAAACTGPIATSTDEMTTCPMNASTHYSAGRTLTCMTVSGIQFFDDVASLEEKVSAAQTAGLGGIGYWTLGHEPSGFLDMIARHVP
jgi:spore germination protein YaaH